MGKRHTGHPPPNNGKAGCLNCTSGPIATSFTRWTLWSMDKISQITYKLSPRALHHSSVWQRGCANTRKSGRALRGQGTELGKNSPWEPLALKKTGREGNGQSRHAHLCYHTDAPHDHCSFGLSSTHSTQSRSDKDLPRQVLGTQVATPSIQHSELQGRRQALTVYSWGSCHWSLRPAWPYVSPQCHGRSLGVQCSSSCRLSSGRT